MHNVMPLHHRDQADMRPWGSVKLRRMNTSRAILESAVRKEEVTCLSSSVRGT